jgi:hypothetical protein
MRALTAVLSLVFILFCHAASAEAEKDVDVKQVQTVLAKLCYEPGVVDGLWGRKTEAAVKAFFSRYNRMYRGKFDKNDEKFVLTVGDGATPRGLVGCKPVNKVSGDKKVQYFDHCCEIPDNTDWQPNDATLEYYYRATASLRLNTAQMYKVSPSSKPKKFKKQIETHKTIDREMAKSTILSYLYYDDGSVVYDALPPKNRFQYKFTDKSYFPSHSMGKSITSYLVGHAICQGYILSVDAPIQDWPLMENTLYYGQPLINLLNMKAGDTHVIKKYDGNFIKTGRNIHGNAPLLKAVRNSSELKDTKAKGGKRYAYSNLTADIIFNYMMHRIGNDFERFIKNFYQNKVKIEYPVYLWMNPLMDHSWSPPMRERIKQGAGQYGISATRYDFLRIAKSMMDDWQNDTCEGSYLKDIYERSISKNDNDERWDGSDRRYGKASFGRLTRMYGGQFHLDVVGLRGRRVLHMNGANGQQIVIDMDKSRIIVIGAVKANDYDTYKLGFEPIKYGRIR